MDETLPSSPLASHPPSLPRHRVFQLRRVAPSRVFAELDVKIDVNADSDGQRVYGQRYLLAAN